ncbi:hypothetical protein [Dactylosporangium darangshiense]
MRSRMIPLLVAALLAMAACSPKQPVPAAPAASVPAAAATTAAAPTTAAAAQKLSVDVVKQQIEPVFTKDPDCPKGEWVTDKGNLDEPYRTSATDFAEYDCHLTDGELVPHRIAQVIYVTFADTKAANDYADDAVGLYPSLIADTTVVVIGAGLKTVDMRQTLRSIENACSCGHVT